MKLQNLVLFVGVFSVLSGCKQASPPVAPPPSTTAAAPTSDPVAAAQAQAVKSPSFTNYLALGFAYINAGRHEEALKAFQQLAVINPQSPIAFNNMCSEYNVLKRWNLAIENCQKALQLEASFTLAKNNLAFAQKSKALQEEKLADLKRKISTGKEVEKSRLDLGMEYYGEGNYETAVDIWKQVPKESNVFANAQNNLASAYILMKKFDLAKSHLDRAIELQPKNQLFLNNRQWLQSASQAKSP